MVVSIGKTFCTVSSVTDTQISCTLGENSAGSYPVVVQLSGEGNSNNDIKFTYDLAITQLSRTQGR